MDEIIRVKYGLHLKLEKILKRYDLCPCEISLQMQSYSRCLCGMSGHRCYCTSRYPLKTYRKIVLMDAKNCQMCDRILNSPGGNTSNIHLDHNQSIGYNGCSAMANIQALCVKVTNIFTRSSQCPEFILTNMNKTVSLHQVQY